MFFPQKSQFLYFFFNNSGNPDTPEGTRLTPKDTSAEGILERRLFHPILIDGGQWNSNADPYWDQSSLKTTGPSSLGFILLTFENKIIEWLISNDPFDIDILYRPIYKMYIVLIDKKILYYVNPYLNLYMFELLLHNNIMSNLVY